MSKNRNPQQHPNRNPQQHDDAPSADPNDPLDPGMPGFSAETIDGKVIGLRSRPTPDDAAGFEGHHEAAEGGSGITKLRRDEHVAPEDRVDQATLNEVPAAAVGHSGISKRFDR